MKYSEDILNSIKTKINMIELASEYTELKKTGKNTWQGKCPHPKHNETNSSFTIYEKEQTWVCFGCHNDKKDNKSNFGSDCIAFIRWIKGFTFHDSVEYLAKKAEIVLPTDKNKQKYEQNKRKNNKYIKDRNEDFFNYLFDRGINLSYINKYELGFDKYNNRITFPLYNLYHEIVGFNMRYISSKGIKYINSTNSEIFNKSTYLYGLNFIDKSFPYIRITEGCTDVILASMYGAKNIVSTLSCNLTEEHVKIIKELNMIPVIIYDNDKAGENGKQRAIELFYKQNIYCKIVNIKNVKDLADLSLIEKENIENYLVNNSLTAGYLQVSDIINIYHKQLYELKLNTQPKIEQVLLNVPQEERKILESYIYDELKIQI